MEEGVRDRFCRDLADLINFGFGYVVEDAGSVLFELELRDGYSITVRVSPEFLSACSAAYAVAPAEERSDPLENVLAVLDIEGENMFRSERPGLRGRRVYDVFSLATTHMLCALS